MKYQIGDMFEWDSGNVYEIIGIKNLKYHLKPYIVKDKGAAAHHNFFVSEKTINLLSTPYGSLKTKINHPYTKIFK